MPDFASWADELLELSLRKNGGEQITLVALYKRATVSKSLLWLFTKEGRERFALLALYKKVTVSNWPPSLLKKEQNRDSLITFLLFRLQKTSDSLEKTKERIPNPVSMAPKFNKSINISYDIKILIAALTFYCSAAAYTVH